MELGSVLNRYLREFGCTAKSLADAAGVSAIQISRWRKGTRRPSAETLPRLAAGLAAISGGTLSERDALAELQEALPTRRRSRSGLGHRLGLLLDTLKVHTSEVSRVLNFDPSYLSRIRSGKRNPSNTEPIIDGVSRYIARRCTSATERAAAAELMGLDASALENAEEYRSALAAWLRGGAVHPILGSADVSALLRALDSFDLNEYIQAFRIEEQGRPGAPGLVPEARSVSGLKNMMQLELDFFRATAMSDSMEPVLIYTDMPISEMAKDPDFPKQGMRAVAAIIKKGLRVEMIHSVDRPFEELLLGLEIHIPMYMTGRITPFYLKESNSGPFRHVLELSGAAALSGEAISGHHAEGRYTLVTDPDALAYYRRRAAALKEKAAPLMDIYTEEQEAEFRSFLRQEAENGFLPVPIDMPAFRNVTVRVCHDRWAVVSKDRAPRVDFVIRHPKLLDAIERFAAPLTDE